MCQGQFWAIMTQEIIQLVKWSSFPSRSIQSSGEGQLQSPAEGVDFGAVVWDPMDSESWLKGDFLSTQQAHINTACGPIKYALHLQRYNVLTGGQMCKEYLMWQMYAVNRFWGNNDISLSALGRFSGAWVTSIFIWWPHGANGKHIISCKGLEACHRNELTICIPVYTRFLVRGPHYCKCTQQLPLSNMLFPMASVTSR